MFSLELYGEKRGLGGEIEGTERVYDDVVG